MRQRAESTPELVERVADQSVFSVVDDRVVRDAREGLVKPRACVFVRGWADRCSQPVGRAYRRLRVVGRDLEPEVCQAAARVIGGVVRREIDLVDECQHVKHSGNIAFGRNVPGQRERFVMYHDD